MLFGKSIRASVTKAINAYIEKVEKEYKEECDQIDRIAEQNKMTAFDKAVHSITSKII